MCQDICVERENGIKFITNLNKNIDGFKGIIDLKEEEISIIPLKFIEEEFSVKLIQIADNRENCDILKYLVGITKQEIKCCEEREKEIKTILNGRVSEKITKEMLIEDGSYEEIKSWFEFIKELYEK